jgi:hypothetical protein
MITRFTFIGFAALLMTPAALLQAQGYGGMHNQPQSRAMPTAPPTTVRQQKQEVVSSQLSAADVTSGITQYVDAASKKSSDKKFHMKHAGQDIALGSLKVHDDRMADLGGGKYVACTNMQGADGKSYDIDFFLSGAPDHVKITETSLHKIDGNALYSWKKQGGVWKKSR